MAKPLKSAKKTVELGAEVRPSRIRRDPAPAARKAADGGGASQWASGEREIWVAIIGIIAFALAINIITFAVSAYTN